MTRYAAFWGAILLSLDAVAGPVLHLTFDHGFEDRSGGSHDAVPIGGAQIDHEHWQVGGGAANFTGASNCFVHVSAYTPAVHNEARSAAFWARATAPCTNAVNVQFLGWGDATPARGRKTVTAIANLTPRSIWPSLATFCWPSSPSNKVNPWRSSSSNTTAIPTSPFGSS